MAKHGEPDWRIERLERMLYVEESHPEWFSYTRYRAIHTERNPGKRVPLPWEMIKCGMVVRRENLRDDEQVINRRRIGFCHLPDGSAFCHSDFTSMEYLDGVEWRPLWTEVLGEEKIVEIVSEEEA